MPGNSDRIRLNSYSIGWGNGVIPINVLSKPFIDRTHRLATTADILIALLQPVCSYILSPSQSYPPFELFYSTHNTRIYSFIKYIY